MESYSEKRENSRYNYRAPMYLYAQDNRDQYYYAEMKDYGKGGQGLLSDREMTVGEKVYIEMKNYDENTSGPEKYKGYGGYIKWAAPYSATYSDEKYDTKYSYRYGIEYDQPAYY